MTKEEEEDLVTLGEKAGVEELELGVYEIVCGRERGSGGEVEAEKIRYSRRTC